MASKKTRSAIVWLLAALITLSSAIYQRRTGPTHPYRGSVELAGETINFRLIRSYHQPSDAPVKVKVKDRETEGVIRFKRYPSYDDWSWANMIREGDYLVAFIPQQPAAGKVMYQITLQRGAEETVLSEEPITIRFRDDVPAWALIPHVIIMFLAMLLSMRTGLAALLGERTFGLTLLTFVSLVAGGLIFGPIVQKYAFGAYWTGWPSGTDLTDNKTAVAFILWLIALVKTWRNPWHRSWVLIAAVGLLVVYMIPHSLLGSEIDWTEKEGVNTAGMLLCVICMPFMRSLFNRKRE